MRGSIEALREAEQVLNNVESENDPEPVRKAVWSAMEAVRESLRCVDAYLDLPFEEKERLR